MRVNATCMRERTKGDFPLTRGGSSNVCKWKMAACNLERGVVSRH